MNTLRMSFRHSLLIAITGLSLAACDSTLGPFEDDGGSGGQCLGYDDTTEFADVSVTIRNTSAEPIYISGLGCTNNLDLRLYDAADNMLSYQRGACHFTCEQLQQSSAVCAADCAVPPVVMIAPGGTHELAWDGTIHQSAPMPTGCHLEPEYAAGSCDQRVVAPEGTYQFELTAHDDSWCPPDSESECACTPDANGSCTVDTFYEITGVGRTARASLSFPSANAAEIVF